MSTDQIIALEDRRYQAMVDRDIATLDELMSPELVYVHAHAATDTKKSYLEKLDGGDLAYLWLDHPIDQLIVQNGAVLVFGRLVGDGALHGVRRQLNCRVLSVWLAQADASWRLTAFQATAIP